MRRGGILAVIVLVLQSCALRPSSVRHIEVDETLDDASAAAAAPTSARRRPADEFERHTFAVAENQSVIGTLLSMQIGPGETLSDVARHFGLGYEEMVQANPDIDPWVPAAASEVLIPQLFILPRAGRRGIVINLAAMRLFRFRAVDGTMQVTTYPVGIGREGKSTPTGAMAIARKTKHPAWYPTKNILADHARRGDPLPAMVPPGPDNPLGDYAMYLTRPSYLIHGTNKPFSVGLRASNGCIRLYPENIEPLFGAVGVREPVQIVNQPYLYGWRGDVLYLQAYPPHEELNAGPLRAAVEADLKHVQDTGHHPLDWDRIALVLREARGIPIPISQGAPPVDAFLASAVPVAHPGVLFGRPDAPTDVSGGWRVSATDTASEITARRVTAVLNHQGPPIPAKAVEVGERYQVIAGPFADANTAKRAAHRIRADLELDPRILPPDEHIAGIALPGEAAARVPAAQRSRPAPEPEPVTAGASGTVESRATAPRPTRSVTDHPPAPAASDEIDRATASRSWPDRAIPVEEAEPVPEEPDDQAPPASTPISELVEPHEAEGSEAESAPLAEPTDAARSVETETVAPDPYDPSAWPEATTAETPSVAPPETQTQEETADPLELLPLEYPPQMYLPDNSADPIRFIEPGSP